MKRIFWILLASSAVFAIQTQKASANQFMRECVSNYKSSYIRSSGGATPPRGQANEYCECAKAALESGDTLSTAVNLCTAMIKNLYGY